MVRYAKPARQRHRWPMPSPSSIGAVTAPTAIAQAAAGGHRASAWGGRLDAADTSLIASQAMAKGLA